ncbi:MULTISPECIES: ParB/RepB/Spo0J family partition protein [Staphylococcus]|jgi:ParB family chromosome partitioning protein|uniref:ParB/RepB/Spo0J family partition protein n=1 Tax=Staphylococcus nepalensis TaxID=214473 RepID=A0A291JP50_9STAP|nr:MULTISPECIES: ParB/RepB/Spo0J family partition protein [Staphylococcus]VDG68346.1 Stage 0 sporulation J, ParB family of DNA-binding proteins [Lacrimispora indolis]ATH61293.1 nucleoid occlusion protein [Staphylococcus nepalensis]ATH66323.1 nucleoid occlusion protein [Staphylococcus nepalensis]AWI45711.1 nucleoid occlusion protein [Staphylococcus nepalensis]MBO1206103.1 ParB/RepB/Spo0J family partition protein [Staphylococcus nepalensis]
MKKPFSKLFGLKNKDDIVGYIEEDHNNGVESIHTERIVPNRYQPRQVFEPNKIKELAESIDEHGLLQPIVVRPIEEGMFEIIAGERRFRALQSLNKTHADVIIRDLGDEETAVVALIENIQRENLSVVEEAEAYKKLLELGETTQSELAKSVGKSQSFIANKLRLLKLAPKVIERLREGKVTERHARAMLSLSDTEQEALVETIISQKLNVKQTEARVKQKVGPEKVKAQRFAFEKDLTDAREAVGKSLEEIEKSGVKYEHQAKDHDDYYEIKIKLYKR